MDSRKRERGTLPLIVGVTGHRDVREEDVERLTHEVDAIFAELTTTFRYTPLIVLSALADGSDRIVAESGLRNGATLVVPLPMPLEEYRTDFTTEKSRAGFDRLCAMAEAVFVVPFQDPKYHPSTPLEGDARNRCYAAGGAYIAVHSDVLIALWNGAPADRVGGTACIVDYKLHGVPEPYGPRPSPLDAVESGPVYHVVTPRARDEGETQGAFAQRRLYPSPWKGDAEAANEFYTDIYGRIDTFNQDSLHPPVAAPPGLQSVADALAIRYRTWSRGILSAIFLIVGFSVIAFEIYAHVAHHVSWLSADVGGFIVATCLFLYARRANVDKKYQDYRALAEGLRVQHFWQLAGIGDSVAAHYLRKQKSELDWIRDAIRSSRVVCDIEAARNTAPRPQADLQNVYDEWIVPQRNWFEKGVAGEQRIAAGYSSTASATFIGGLVVALAVVVWLFVFKTDFADERRDHVVALIALTAAVAGLLYGYAEKRAWSSHAKQYHRMQLIFSNAAATAKPLLADPSPENIASLRGLYTELGREALIENGDWLLLHRERRTDIPV